MTPTLLVNEKGQKGLYVNNTLIGTWDKYDPDKHVWSQVARKVDADEVEERHIEGPLPAKLEQPKTKKAAPKRKPAVEAEKPEPEDDTPKGPMTSYQTGAGNVEAL